MLDGIGMLEEQHQFPVVVDFSRFLEDLPGFDLGRRVFAKPLEFLAPVEKRPDHGDLGVERYGTLDFRRAKVAVFEDLAAGNLVEVFLRGEVVAEIFRAPSGRGGTCSAFG